jgi:hypothetical protein
LAGDVFDPETLLRLAADYRARAETAANLEQRVRHVSLADYCEQLATAIALRPKGLPARVVDAVCRRLRAAKPMPQR